jgi:outer membrane protein TolC
VSQPLSLLEVLRMGRERGVEAAVSRLAARPGHERASERLGELMPTLQGSAGWSCQDRNLDELGIPFVSGVTDPISTYRLGLRASQTLFDGSAIARIGAARDHARAGDLDAQAAGDIASATAGLAYLSAVGAGETVRAREADSAVVASLFDQARRQVEAGVSPSIDATRSEVAFEAVRTQLEVARNAEQRAILDLVQALDLPPATELTLREAADLDDHSLSQEAGEAAAFARDHRADLAAEVARTSAARKSLNGIRYENLPSLSVGYTYAQSGLTSGGLDPTNPVQVMVTVPILDGFQRQHRAHEQGLRVVALDSGGPPKTVLAPTCPSDTIS